MDLRGLVVVLTLVLLELCCVRSANLVLPVERKFKCPVTSLSEIANHDALRHGRFLSAVDINIGGSGSPSGPGLYYTKIGLGTPAKDYYVQVDTGSDLLWVNCIGCTSCPTESGIGMDLTLYDPKGSNTSKVVGCSDKFCNDLTDGQISCKQGMTCPYSVTYGDGSQSSGFYVKDALTYNQVNGDLQTTQANSSVFFGCGARQSGPTGSNTALSGIMGFGQANYSALSQLAASGKVKKVFSHCLETNKGGGIFAIGEVVAPKYNTTSFIPRKAHYNVLLKDMEVDGQLLQLPTDIFDAESGREAIIDSGTTLAFLPRSVYDQLYQKILGRQPGLKIDIVSQQFSCFQYDGNVDDGFPVVKFHFDGITLTVHPRDYLFQYNDMRCVGWMKSTQQKDGKDLMILGDLVLSNKLVVYDIENMVIGWTDYDCSSSVRVKDESTGTVYTVGAHRLNSASSVFIGRLLNFFLFLVAILNIF